MPTFDKARFAALCPQATLLLLDECGSTNDEAKRLALSGAPHGQVVIARQQSYGRGRMGRRFFSPAGRGLYLTIVVRDCTDFMLLTSAAAAAVHRALQTVCGVTADIKWVNDLLLGGKKIGGILSEGVTENGVLTAAVVGIGINVYAGSFAPELRELASSVLDCAPESDAQPYRMEFLAAAVVNELSTFCADMDRRAFLEDCRKYSCVLGQTVRVLSPTDVYSARALAIDNNGALVVDRDGAHIVLHTGEVSIRF